MEGALYYSVPQLIGNCMPKVSPKYPIFLIIFLLAGVNPLHGVETTACARQGLVTVDSLLIENQFLTAITEARHHQKLFQDDPHWSAQFENRLAIALLRADQPEEALPLLEARVINHPSEAQAHRNLGACLLALGRKGRALSEYKQVVELEPGNANARLEYGQVLLDFRIFKDAGDQILTAAGLCDNCLEVQPVLARYYQAVSQPANAVGPWRSYWLETGNPVARRNLLKVLLESGQDQEVLDLLLLDSPQDLPLDELQQMVAAEGRLGVSDQSLWFARRLVEEGETLGLPGSVADDPWFWGQVSINLLASGRHGEALAAVNRAIALEPVSVVFLNNRVVLLQKLGRHQEADREWEKTLLLDPSLKRKKQ